MTITAEQKKHNADAKKITSSRRKLLAFYHKEMKEWKAKEAQKQIEVDYRKWEHDQRMMWSRENYGTNQCIPAGGWAILLNRIAATPFDWFKVAEENVRAEYEAKLGRLPLWWWPCACLAAAIPIVTLALIIFT